MENQENVKKELEKIVKSNIRKSFILQKSLTLYYTREDSSFFKKRQKKNKGKVIVENVFLKITRHNLIVREACYLHEALFNEKIDIKSIVNKYAEDFEESLSEKSSKESKIIIPDDAPDEIKELCNSLASGLKSKTDKKFSIEVIDMKNNSFGLDPKDFDNPRDFITAIMQAKQLEDGEKTSEEILTETMVRQAEEATKNPNKSKLN